LWILFSLHAIYDKAGKHIMSEGLVTDIAERKLKERAEQAREISDAKNTAKSQFFASMSHELRGPLTAIIGYSSVAKDRSASSQKRLDAASVIDRSGRKLLNLIDDILDLSKIEAQKLTIELMDVNPIELIREVEDTSLILAEQKGLAFNREFAFPLPKIIRTDPTRLKQILLNLCSNAIKFTDSGAITIKVYLDNEKITFAVCDTGIGLTPEQIGKLFRPFEQADKSVTREYGGTGLGLYVSTELAQALGGEITVESVFGEGSTFAVSIYTGELSGVEMVTSVPVPLTHRESSANREFHKSMQALARKNILLADDDDLTREVISMMLEDYPFDITHATNGDEALALMSGNDFDCVILDVSMPGKGGFEVAQHFQQSNYQGAIIFVTGYSDLPCIEKCLELGSSYFQKPVVEDVFWQLMVDLYIEEDLKPVYRHSAVEEGAEKNSSERFNIAKLLEVNNGKTQQVVKILDRFVKSSQTYSSKLALVGSSQDNISDILHIIANDL
ncbi:MAG: response regulator, partial [Lentisphaeria bacterium]|nr:response regulator [Lentisphaeria bacterium]